MQHCHYWKIGAITDGVAQGICKCGAVKTFDAIGDSAHTLAAARINADGRRRLGLAAEKKVQQPPKHQAVVPTAPSNGAVTLPAFSNEWQPAVQIKWLETYQVVYTGSNRQEVTSVKDNKAGG